VGAAALAVALALTGCRPADNGDDPGDDGLTWDVGVTEEPCPDTVNEDNGCIYLGILTDLTGPFAGFGGPLVSAQEAFWQRVNEAGGITAPDAEMAFDVDVTSYRRDTGYDTTLHSQAYEEIKPNVLALAQTLGTPTTLAILDDLKASDVVAVPAGYTSLFNFEDIVLESMSNYCVDAMNAIDYAVETYEPATVMAVHYPGDYGGDAAAGVMIAAEAHGLEFIDVQTGTGGGDAQAEAIGQILTEQPDLVMLTVGPTETATIVGGAAANGFTGRFIGSGPTWNPALLGSPAGDALVALYQVASPLDNYETDTPGHQAMRDALGGIPENVNDGYTSGWIWQYPMKAALEAAAASGDLTRAGLRAAAGQLTSVDYEGMIPGGGNYAGGPDAQLRQTNIAAPDRDTQIGVSTVREWFTGPTAEAWTPEVCYERLG
jgi:ABC-type branched-subunit amino acid transport system substrate-binding protein